MKRKLGLLVAAFTSTVAVTFVTHAQQDSIFIEPDPVANFEDAIKLAVLQSPRVNATYYNFLASRDAQRVAQGGYFPRVDVISEWGRERRETPIVDFSDGYDRDATRFSITQMLFDGFFTRDEVARLGYTSLDLYYQFKNASEFEALEAVRAYLDVLRFQQLVDFAEDNYVVHRQVYDRIEERTSNGVSQGVDLEQAAARIALAESNLVTEVTNLHDVRVRFQNVIGALPAETLQEPSIPGELIPELRESALEAAYRRSPAINAAIENLRANQEAVNSANAPMMPRLDLRYRNDVEHNTDGFEGRYDTEAVEVVITYNLFRGGSDIARKREFYNLYNAAMEERKQACRNVRQEVMIAFNDVEALEEQVILLDRNRAAQDRTRRAYRDQFDLGQRTLLDLLDSQNEFFDTQRAYASARADLMIAQAETLANIGILLSSMDVEGLNAERIREMNLDLTRDPDDENAQALCPPEAPQSLTVDREALFASLTGRSLDDGSDLSGVGVGGAAAVAALAAGSNRYVDAGGNMVSVDLDVKFELNSSTIREAFDQEIGKAATVLNENPDVLAIVEGHTDTTGTPEYNQWLSERRANSVREVMINGHGVNPNQIAAAGYGQTRPRSSNDTLEGRQNNRRVELVLKAQN
ncbi:MAG: TolC family outer membrane protein [Pseudomonadota bacterium]